MKDNHLPQLLSSTDWLSISNSLKADLARQASRLLSLYPETMLPSHQQEILDFIKNGRVVMLTDPLNNDMLIAYARLYEWPGLNQNHQRLFEFRSWIVNPDYLSRGYGAYILHQAVALGRGIDINAQIIAVVEKRSHRALSILDVAGGLKIPKNDWPKNLKILLKSGDNQARVIDITNINHYLKPTNSLKKKKKNILLSIGREDNKKCLLPYIKKLVKINKARLYATQKTHIFLKQQGIDTILVFKISQTRSRPNIRELLNQKSFDLIINIPTGQSQQKEITDGLAIRLSAIEKKIPLITDVSLVQNYINKICHDHF